MRSTTASSTNPWGTSIDDGWKDLVVSSAPPPPPREAMEPVVRNRPLPADFNTWQEHGAPRVASVEMPVEEPNFTAADRRLWLIAGTLMGLAALVLGLLGVLTFGGASSVTPAAAPQPAAEAAPALEPAHASAAHASAAHATAARTTAAVNTRSSNPRILKASAHSNRSHHHKRVASR
jgi:hypothetical protein